MMRPTSETFEELKDIFNQNSLEEELVTALNRLTDDKRNIYIMYIQMGNNARAVAEKMKCSGAWMCDYIRNIKKEIRQYYDEEIAKQK